MKIVCGAVAVLILACTPALAFSQPTPTSVPTPAPVPTPASADSGTDAKFDVLEYRVLGNSTLTSRQIETALYPLLGPDKHFADVELARAALERAYHDLGYGAVFVDVPEQEVRDGVVRLHVTEGRLDRVRVTGARYYSNRALLAELPEVASGSSPNFQVLQQQIAQANLQTANRRVVPVLRAGRTPGAVDLDLKVEDELPVHASLQLDNRYTADSKPLRATGSLSYDNLWQRGDSLSLQYQTAPQATGSVKVWAGTYLMRFADARPVLSTYVINTNSSVATLGALSVLGAGRIYGMRMTLPFIGDSDSQSLAFGLDYKKFRDDIRVTNDLGLGDEVSYLNFAAQYTFNSFDTHGATALTGGASLGFRSASGAEQTFDNKRYAARPNYLVLRASASRTQVLFKKFSAYVSLEGQFSGEPLISNEQFSAGGATSVRGYYEAEALGDMGLQSTFELRSPPLGRAPIWRSAYLFTFFDSAVVDLQQPLPSQIRRYTLDSAGVGLRIGPYYHIESGIDWAYPLRDAARTLRGQDRVEFFLRYAR